MHARVACRLPWVTAILVAGLALYALVSFTALSSVPPVSTPAPFMRGQRPQRFDQATPELSNHPPSLVAARNSAAAPAAAHLAQQQPPTTKAKTSIDWPRPFEQKQRGAAQRTVALQAKDTVLAMSQNIATDALLVFIRSFREHNKHARIVLFQQGGDTSLSLPLQQQYDVTIQRSGGGSLPAFMRGFHPSTTRWHIMLQYMQEHLQGMQRILLADVRDTMFQLDPFSSISASAGAGAPPVSDTALLSWYEQSGKIGTCSWNSGWVRDCFGVAELKRLFSERIICSGITLGGRSAVHRYLQRMNSTVFEKRACERNGVDQGMHQVVMRDASWQGGLQVRLAGVELGQVAHMQSMPQRALGADGLLRATSTRDVYTIVHQYDRAAAISTVFMDKYGQVPE